MELIAQANEGALGTLYDRYGRLVFSVAYGVVGHHSTAEEITLDVFTRVWRKADTYNADLAKVSTWLTRMTRNRAIDVLRREEVRPLKHSISWAEIIYEPTSDHANPERATDLTLQKQRVRAALDELPETQREVLALAYFKGLSHRQIAELLGQPLGTVKGRIRGGMKKLRQVLGDG